MSGVASLKKASPPSLKKLAAAKLANLDEKALLKAYKQLNDEAKSAVLDGLITDQKQYTILLERAEETERLMVSRRAKWDTRRKILKQMRKEFAKPDCDIESLDVKLVNSTLQIMLKIKKAKKLYKKLKSDFDILARLIKPGENLMPVLGIMSKLDTILRVIATCNSLNKDISKALSTVRQAA
jgi:hypothetical protein